MVDGRLVRVRGRSFRVVDDKPTFWAKAEAGLWEPETLAAIERTVAPGDAFLDIGAWVGPTALFAAALGARVVAVEADPVATAALHANVAANPELAGGIAVIHAAAAPQEGPVRLGAARKRGDSMSSALLAERGDSWEVAGVSPTELIARAVPAPGGSLVVKVDIEGGEYALAPALAAALPDHTRAVLLALHPRLLEQAGSARAEIETLTAAALGAFTTFRPVILETGPGEEPLEKIAERENVTLFLTRPSHRKGGGD